MMTTANGTMTAPTSLPPTGAEAPASLTLKFQLHGFDTMLTLRGASGADVLPKATAAIGWLEANGATATAPKGSSRKGPPPPPDPNAPRCPTHGSPMRQGKRGWFCPRKDGDAYCQATA